MRLAVVVVAAVDEELLLPELGPRAPEFDRFIGGAATALNLKI